MNILARDPVTWRDLQNSVQKVLNGCCYIAETEKTINILRGNVEVDVYATKTNGHKTILICECKQLNKNATQSVVHAFKTVVEGAGASQGFIITKKGFQKGAIKAATNTNISLFTWSQFQEQFEMEYLNNVIRRNENKGRELSALANYLLSNGKRDFGAFYQDREGAFLVIRHLYSDMLLYTFRDNYSSLVTNLITKEEVDDGINRSRNDMSTFDSYMQYFDRIYNYCCHKIHEIEKVFEYKIIWDKIKLNEKGY